jgi:hypothetical protein
MDTLESQVVSASDPVGGKHPVMSATDIRYRNSDSPNTNLSPTTNYFGFQIVEMDWLVAMGPWGWRQLAVMAATLLVWAYLVHIRDARYDLPFFQHGREFLLFIVFMSYLSEWMYRTRQDHVVGG